MPILKDEIQILRVHEQSNSSQIFVALGRRLGQFHVIAKGIRRWPKKGYEGGLDLLARGELLAYPRPDEQLWIFKEWDERARPSIGQSYRMLAAGSYLCELAEALTRHTAGAAEYDEQFDGAHHNLYDLLAVSAEALAAKVMQPGVLLLGYTMKAFEAEGVLLPLEHCHTCNRKFFDGARGTAHAWLAHGGVECKSCVKARVDAMAGKKVAGERFITNERGIWLGAEAHRALLHIKRTMKPLRLSVTAADQLARALALLVHGALERDLRTLNYAIKVVRAMGK